MKASTVSETMRLWKNQPEKAIAKPSVRARDDGAQAVLYAGTFSWRADLPPSLGGSNAAPSPTAVLLDALMPGAVALTLLGLLCISAQPLGAQSTPTAVVADSPVDKQYPTGLASFTVPSHGVELDAWLYVASGAGPHGSVILPHGLPGCRARRSIRAKRFRSCGKSVRRARSDAVPECATPRAA